jgi:hypothetical protein
MITLTKGQDHGQGVVISRPRKLRQMAYKPGSVLRSKPDGWPFLWDAHRCAPRRDLPGRRCGNTPFGIASYPNGRPYLVLLQVGFALPLLLPAARCALTAPFHPYQHKLAVCFLWHFPWGYPRRTLSGTLLPWSPDFPPFASKERPSGHLARTHNERLKLRGQAARAAANRTATAAMRAAVSLSNAPSTLLWR